MTGLSELQKCSGPTIGLGRNSGVWMPWKAGTACLAVGEMIGTCEETGDRGELPPGREVRGKTPKLIGLGLGLAGWPAVEDEDGVEEVEEDVALDVTLTELWL